MKTKEMDFRVPHFEEVNGVVGSQEVFLAVQRPGPPGAFYESYHEQSTFGEKSFISPKDIIDVDFRWTCEHSRYRSSEDVDGVVTRQQDFLAAQHSDPHEAFYYSYHTQLFLVKMLHFP